jgi:hypothetical protein
MTVPVGEATTMNHLRRSAVMTMAVVALGLCSCAGPKKLSPELQAFADACKKIQPGMTEAEVDAIMHGYPIAIFVGDETRNESGGPFSKSYDSKRGATEGDYYLFVSFDAERRLVDWQIVGYTR